MHRGARSREGDRVDDPGPSKAPLCDRHREDEGVDNAQAEKSPAIEKGGSAVVEAQHESDSSPGPARPGLRLENTDRAIPLFHQRCDHNQMECRGQGE